MICLDGFLEELRDAGSGPDEAFLMDWFTGLRSLWDTYSDGRISSALEAPASGEALRFWIEGQAIYLLLMRDARGAVIFLHTIEPFKRELWKAISTNPPWDLRYVANVGVATLVLQSARDLISRAQAQQTATVEKVEEREWKQAAVWGRVELVWVIEDDASSKLITSILGNDP